MSSHRSPAVVRLERARWLMTALVTVITAAAVLVFGYVAAAIDAHARQTRAEDRVELVVNGLARAIQHDDKQVLDLSTVIDDELAKGSTAVVVAVRKPGEPWKQAHTYQRSLMPDDTQIATLATPVEDHADGITYQGRRFTGTDITGRSVTVAGSPVFWNDWDNIVVILAGTESADDAGAHRTLV
ncbi:hypothetical protein [Nocardia seriolae]|uniref:hypothetical protein n=1 Tax=Nocardia seriolae TaxID=37332 RepID=UPI0004AF9BC2|nr:hypothetical protein [Nocardia seriolae]